MAFVRAEVALATIAPTIPAPVLLLALRSAAVVAVFSPVSRFSRYFGVSALLRPFRLFSWATLLVLPFFAPPVSSPLLSHLQGLALCVFAAARHLCWSGCGFRVRPSAPSYLDSHFSTFSYASLLCVLPMFVSPRSGLVAVYVEAGFLGGSHVGVCGSGS